MALKIIAGMNSMRINPPTDDKMMTSIFTTGFSTLLPKSWTNLSNLSVAEANLDTSRNWEFGPAIFFASTVVTTIGKETVHVLYIIPIGPFRLWQYLSCYIWRQTVLHILRDGRHTNSTGLPRFSW